MSEKIETTNTQSDAAEAEADRLRKQVDMWREQAYANIEDAVQWHEHADRRLSGLKRMHLACREERQETARLQDSVAELEEENDQLRKQLARMCEESTDLANYLNVGTTWGACTAALQRIIELEAQIGDRDEPADNQPSKSDALKRAREIFDVVEGPHSDHNTVAYIVGTVRKILEHLEGKQ
jgi:bacterioferritin-associated ferredoxin